MIPSYTVMERQQKQKLTAGFQTVVQWFQQNCLMVNIKKTQVCFYRKKRRSEIQHLCVEHDGWTLRNEQQGTLVSSLMTSCAGNCVTL